ncbi:MAG: hypothetical protein LH473_04285 [Chitinophagales bacterium]|nr:hypothetical protein [Chitinophagales bacterium]
MLTKKKVFNSFKDLPENFSVEELLDRIIFLQKIEAGLLDSANGNTFSTAEAKKRMKKWLTPIE